MLWYIVVVCSISAFQFALEDKMAYVKGGPKGDQRSPTYKSIRRVLAGSV